MTDLIFVLLALALAITVHEAAHAWMANRLGDPTAKLMGRLSLNPLVHYDPVGSTILLITAVLTALGAWPFPFGWAKPVMFDPYNLQNPRRDSALISLAGPVSNLATAIAASLILRLIQVPFSPFYFLSNFAYLVIILNISLAVFNLIPVHPLDGGKILVGVLPAREAASVENFLSRYGIFVLLILIMPTFGGNSILSGILGPAINILISILVPGRGLI